MNFLKKYGDQIICYTLGLILVIILIIFYQMLYAGVK